MSCFGEYKLLNCRSCNQNFTLSEEIFPDDLFFLLSKYDIPQIHWYCKSCNKCRVTQRDIEKLNSRVTMLETGFTDMRRVLRPDREADDHTSESPVYAPIKVKYRNTTHADSTGSPPLRSRSSSPRSSNYSFRSADYSSERNKEAHQIIHSIVNTKIKIDKDEAKNSIDIVDAFLLEINPYLKNKDPVFKYMYNGDYKTGSSYNDLKISSADEYDININFILPRPFELKVEFFKETMAFAKIKWSIVSQIPDSKICLLNFLENNSDKNRCLDPLKIKSWFQGLVENFCLSNCKIRGIKKFTNSQSGPARTIKIKTEKDDYISLDLVPVFKFDFDIFSENKIPRLNEYSLDVSKRFCSFVPKTCDGEEDLLARDCKVSWRIYIPEIDKKVLYNKECAKSVIRLLKLLLIKKDWKLLASYHMVTVILWEIKENPNDWSGKMLFDRFIKALERLERYLYYRKIPYFLYPQYNLIHSLNEKTCENWSNCIQGIVKSLKSDPNELNNVFKDKVLQMV